MYTMYHSGTTINSIRFFFFMCIYTTTMMILPLLFALEVVAAHNDNSHCHSHNQLYAHGESKITYILKGQACIEQICENGVMTANRFECIVRKCVKGETLMNRPKECCSYYCDIVNECLNTTTNNCTLSTKCVNDNNGYRCDCIEGYDRRISFNRCLKNVEVKNSSSSSGGVVEEEVKNSSNSDRHYYYYFYDSSDGGITEKQLLQGLISAVIFVSILACVSLIIYVFYKILKHLAKS